MKMDERTRQKKKKKGYLKTRRATTSQRRLAKSHRTMSIPRKNMHQNLTYISRASEKGAHTYIRSTHSKLPRQPTVVVMIQQLLRRVSLSQAIGGAVALQRRYLPLTAALVVGNRKRRRRTASPVARVLAAACAAAAFVELEVLVRLDALESEEGRLRGGVGAAHRGLHLFDLLANGATLELLDDLRSDFLACRESDGHVKINIDGKVRNNMK